MKNRKDCGKLRAELTVEMTFIIPFVLFIFLIIIYTVFYFHDKVILNAAAGETIAVGAQSEREYGKEDTDLQQFYRDRTEHKLIFLHLKSVHVEKGKTKISVSVEAGKGPMRLKVISSGRTTYPEKEIRRKRKWESTKGDKEQE